MLIFFFGNIQLSWLIVVNHKHVSLRLNPVILNGSEQVEKTDWMLMHLLARHVLLRRFDFISQNKTSLGLFQRLLLGIPLTKPNYRVTLLGSLKQII